MKRRITVGGPKAFRKMRLVPIDDAEDSYEREKRLRHYDPALTSMAQSLHHIDHPKIVDGDYTSALATQNAYLRRLKRHSLQQRNQLQQAVVSNTAGQQVPTADAANVAVEPLPTLQMPSAYRAKFTRLLAALEKNRGAIGRTSADELVIDGAVQRGTSFTGSMRGLYVNSKEPPAGTRQLVRKLAELRVPANLISSKAALAMYTQGGEGSGSPKGAVRSRVLHVY